MVKVSLLRAALGLLTVAFVPLQALAGESSAGSSASVTSETMSGSMNNTNAGTQNGTSFGLDKTLWGVNTNQNNNNSNNNSGSNSGGSAGVNPGSNIGTWDDYYKAHNWQRPSTNQQYQQQLRLSNPRPEIKNTGTSGNSRAKVIQQYDFSKKN